MKRNRIGGLIVAGGLTLASSLSGFADYSPASAKAAIDTCATPLALTNPATLTGEASKELLRLNQAATLGMAEITSESKALIDRAAAEAAEEATAEATSEHGDHNASLLTTQLSAIVTRACAAVNDLKADYAAALAELKAEANQPAAGDNQQQQVKQVVNSNQENEDADKSEVEKQDSEKSGAHKSDSQQHQRTQPITFKSGQHND